MEHLGDDTAKGSKKLLTTFMHRLAELYVRHGREDPKSQALKPVQGISSNTKATLSAPLAEEQSDFKIGQVHSLDPLGHNRLKYYQPGETYSTNPTGAAVAGMNGPSLLPEFGAGIDIWKHTGQRSIPASLRGGVVVLHSPDGRKIAF